MKTVLFLSGICLLLLSFLPPQSRVVQGNVFDEHKKPVDAASIQIKGTRTGTTTNAAGHFSIGIQSEKDILIVSALGYQPREIKVNGKDNIGIILKAQQNSLGEVVVTGLGVQREESDAKLFYSPAPAATALQGKASGVMVTSRSKYRSDKQYERKKGYFPNADYDREGYDKIEENPFLKATDNPLSTFSIDVDAASYSNIRRMLNAGQLPPAGAVRIEEMINYFTYQYPQPNTDAPFSINTELAACPWNPKHKLALIGLQGKIIPTENLPASNLVFLIDVSGSMMEENKLPLVQSSLKLLTSQLRPQDKVSLVVYAGNAGLVLPPTGGDKKETIKAAISALEAGGSTAGGQGIALAYKTAKQNFIKGGNNRVILCTDGDFNVGISSDDELERMIEQERESGVFLSVLGYGTGNYQDAKMQKLADKGNGNHAYIDGISEANKVLVQQFGGTLFTIAKDVKLQVEFNPAKVQGYRLIGYENRMLAKEDFNDDKKDAGELGSGHTVTALYEIIPTGIKAGELKNTDALRYTKTDDKPAGNFTNELMNIKLRYKQPDGNTSVLLQHPVTENGSSKISDNFRLAASVAQFGMLLRNSSYKASASYEDAANLTKQTLGNDKEGYRKELLQLIEEAAKLADEAVTKKED